MPDPAIHMRWANLLFVHWPVDPASMSKHLPPGASLDVFDGKAWIGLVPFRMEQVRVRGWGRLAGPDAFYECNVRTYITVGEARGVWFLSLDAEALRPVLGGRLMWGLNYVHARFDVSREGDVTSYALRRRWGRAGGSKLRWRSGEALPLAAPGTLEHFLTERYWLFAQRRDGLWQGRVEHPSWPLRRAELEVLDDSLVAEAGIAVSGVPHVLASDGVDTIGFALERAARDETDGRRGATRSFRAGFRSPP